MLARLEESVDAGLGRAHAGSSRAAPGASRSCVGAREQLRDLGRELDELVNSVHRDEMARTQQRMRIEQLEERALEELGLDADALVAEYGPDQLGARSRRGPEGRRAAAAGRRSTARSRPSGCARAERALAQLGRINPLALEEFSALEERHKFLTEQLEDLKSTRKDLLDIVARGRRPRASRSSPRRTPT